MASAFRGATLDAVLGAMVCDVWRKKDERLEGAASGNIQDTNALGLSLPRTSVLGLLRDEEVSLVRNFAIASGGGESLEAIRM